MTLISFIWELGECSEAIELERVPSRTVFRLRCFPDGIFLYAFQRPGAVVGRASEEEAAWRGAGEVSVSGRGDQWRFAERVAAQEAEGMSLRERLLWRVGELTSAQSIDLGAHIEDFPEVKRGFTVPGFETRVVSRDEKGKLISKASIDDGGSIVVTGGLWVEGTGEYAASFRRRLQFAPDWALHEWLVVAPEHRGRGLGPRFLLSSFGLYDALELEQVHVVASLETGRWYWAHMGFDFIKPEEKALVHAWANEVCAALGLGDSILGPDSSAGQIARLDCEQPISLEVLAQAMPNQRERLEEEIAEKNGMAMARPISLGRAIMLSGPQWRGFLQLKGAHRLAFEEAAAERTGKPVGAPEAGVPEQDSATPKRG